MGGQRGLRRIVHLSLVALALAPIAVPTAAAYPYKARGRSTCTYEGTIVRVRFLRNYSIGVLSRDETGVILYDGGEGPQPCGAATVYTTQRIVIRDLVGGAKQFISLDVSNGHFSNGANDIPIRIDLGRGYDGFHVFGSDRADFWTFGRKRGNLQRDDDAEINFVKGRGRLSGVDFARAEARVGANRVCMTGGHGTGPANEMGWLIMGGKDPDRFCGSNGADQIFGQGGNDTLRGNSASDVVDGERGDDIVRGDAGKDFLAGQEGSDRLFGGPGRDYCSGGSGPDLASNCDRRL